MDLSTAIDAHRQWRVKLEAAITRGEKLVASLRLFHAAAGKVAGAANAGKTAEAESLLSGPFQAQSQETVAAIQACRKACK